MAHELSLRADGRAEMAFVGETPWHGLGTSLTKGASIGVWIKEAGMDWTAQEAVPLYHCNLDKPGALRSDDTNKVLYRSDTGAPLSIVSSKYEVVQPAEVLEFFRGMTENEGWWIHTAGCLRGGRKVWALATNGERASVGKGDEIIRNILMATSLDGSMRTTCLETDVRVVCANTLAMAERQGKGIQVSHRSVFDAAQVRNAMGIKQDNFKAFMAQAKEMADTPIKLDDAREVLRSVLKIPATATKLAWLGDLSQIGQEPEAKESRALESILALFQGAGMGADLKTAKGTQWGLLNAVTEYVDHHMGRTPDGRLDGAWFGRGATIKADAVKALALV